MSFITSFLLGVDSLSDNLETDSTFLLFLLIPPLIFEAGVEMNVKSFVKHGAGIGWLAIVGTFVSILSIGLTFRLFGMFSLLEYSSLQKAMNHGALLSSIDPVGVLSVMKHKTSADFVLLFGESVLNDSLCLFIFRQTLPLVSLSFTSVLFLPLRIGFILTISVLTGFLSGIFGSLCFNGFSINNESPLLLLVVYLLFSACEYVEISGVAVVFFFAMSVSRYVEEEKREILVGSLKSLSKLVELVNFCWLGISLNLYKTGGDWSVWLLMVVVGSCVGSRILSVKIVSKLTHIESNCERALIVSGMRGVVTFGLSVVSGNRHLQSTCLALAWLGPSLASVFSPLVGDEEDIDSVEADGNGVYEYLEELEATYVLPLLNNNHDVGDDRYDQI